MKIFISFLVLALAGLGVWALWPDENSDVALVSISPSPTVSSPADIAESPTPTPSVTTRATPQASPSPVPTPQGQGGEGPPPSRAPVFTSMASMNGSGQYGVVAVMANEDDLAMVSFNLTGGPGGVYQHASIVSGTCSSIGGAVYSLQPLMNGSSTTTLNVDFLDIVENKNRLAVVVYSPEDTFPITYACGQLR